MTKDTQIKLALEKSSSLGRSQAGYMMTALVAAALCIIAPSYEMLVPAQWLLATVSALCVMAWIGIGRAAAEMGSKLKELVSDYNYGAFGGAPPFVWAIAYSPHGKGGLQRALALVSFPVALTAVMAVAWSVLIGPDWWHYAWLSIPSWQVIKLWVNRIRAI